MKYLKKFNEKLSIGDNTNLGIITDITDTQYEIDNKWFHKTLVKVGKHIKEPLRNRGISVDKIISAFSNPIDSDKLSKYIEEMLDLQHNFPPIKGYPIQL